MFPLILGRIEETNMSSPAWNSNYPSDLEAHQPAIHLSTHPSDEESASLVPTTAKSPVLSATAVFLNSVLHCTFSYAA